MYTMISLEISEDADDNWNTRLSQSDLGTMPQINETGQQFLTNNQIPHYVKFLDSTGKIIGQLLMSETPRFQEAPYKKKKLSNKLGKFSGLLNLVNVKTKLYRWSYGPVIFEKEHSRDIYESLSNYLLSDKSYQVSGWQHPFQTDGLSGLSKNFDIVKWGTFIIDLTIPKDELFQKIDKNSGRKNIKRAINQGITVEEINDNNLYEYFVLLNADKPDRGGSNSNFEDFQKLWNTLKPIGRTGFIARKDLEILSGLTFTYFSNHIIEGAVARSNSDKENSYYSQDLIRWKIIEWGIDNKMKWYNLAGFNPNLETKKEEGIFRYKKKWGGKKYEYFGIKIL
jgi:lipid II:glycine glycyltransferase (peptidoglycan interpeptide bridge formation enzyme)